MWKVTVTFHIRAETAPHAMTLMTHALDEALVYEELDTWVPVVDGWELLGAVESDLESDS